MQICTPSFGKHSFSSPQKESPKKKKFPPLKSTLVKKSPFAEVFNFGQIWD
jgi:hypothetical protein